MWVGFHSIFSNTMSEINQIIGRFNPISSAGILEDDMFEINQRTHFTAFPMQKIFKYIGMFLLFVFAAQSIAQTSKASQADRDRAALRQFPEIARAVKGVSPVIDRAARNHAEASMSAATGNKATITSRDRPANSPIASRAHDRGAIDAVTPNMRKDAAGISRRVGPGYTTIHEQPVRPAQQSRASSRDIHTVYRGGKAGTPTSNPPRATREHIHVQPEFNKRLHEAASPAPRSPSSKKQSSSTGKSNGAGVR